MLYDSEKASNLHIRNLAEKSFLLEDRVSGKTLSLDENIILLFLLPQMITQNMFVFDSYAQRRIKKTVIEIQIEYFEHKMKDAKDKEDYEKAIRFEKISRGLKKFLKKNETN
ncbi:MAG TPA: hypothetical protein PK466_06495 [Thermotogota bacterium]|nr:hypothetical protein [Thermotogota bacterium]HPJ88691.1 hypothetical protein [Thermotogota bacterium]HPR95960.1 hypothetical protein [Thermotogota bacterium]